jgi:hypothetical protein
MSSKEEDYLDEDKPLRHAVKKQNFCVISMLTPNAFPESRREEFKDQKILGLKIRGVFETYEEAKEQAAKLQKLDKFHNVFVGEIGKWLPFDVDISNMQTEEDSVYREKSLNTYMKAYKDTLKEEEVSEKERKDEQLKGANVVTGKTDAPLSTGLGTTHIGPPSSVVKKEPEPEPKPEPEPELDLESVQLKKVDEYAKVSIAEEDVDCDDDIDSQIKKSNDDKIKLVNDLEESKNYMKLLEEKLSTINNIYSELKK